MENNLDTYNFHHISREKSSVKMEYLQELMSAEMEEHLITYMLNLIVFFCQRVGFPLVQIDRKLSLAIEKSKSPIVNADSIWVLLTEIMTIINSEYGEMGGVKSKTHTLNSEVDHKMIYLYKEKNIVRDKLISKKLSILESLRILLGELSPEILHHSRRMRIMVTKIGKSFNLSGLSLKKLILTAELHDLGKIGVEEAILKKTKSLTSADWKRLKKHPLYGYCLAKRITMIPGVAEGVLLHHERWDGKGYPIGLKKEEIPFEARMITIIDAYDAMVYERGYKEVLSPDQAKDELRRCAGTQFDPLLIRAFLSI
ncbi:HD-GYP domain-containing protein [Tindallia californiensis]|uniref:HD domain-containing protein n=1 Tax=Tindallia californiensis TaxID=159292 RepID=A0A1H3M7W8_9FIRM|nr:HD domain-containing phosphohydrolase [Tindallia californiensis]SDY72384.1 HD domain-containing protein [Tindallia californiensis]